MADYRYLNERDKARDDGDKLAVVLTLWLDGKANEEDLCLALRTYQSSQGWLGSACNQTLEVIDYDNNKT